MIKDQSNQRNETLPTASENIRGRLKAAALLLVLLLTPFVVARAQSGSKLRIEDRVVHTATETIPAEVGHFEVPQNYHHPSGKAITLAFIRFKSTEVNPGAPILYLAGGPGTSGITYATGPKFEPYLTLRQFGDVIALDQRGTGLSEPNLTCPDRFVYPLNKPADREQLTRACQRFAHDCALYWRGKGVDLKDYNTEASADDVKALADILGVKQVRLFGASYGSHLGLSIIRRHPEIVERAVLGGIEGPDQTIKLPANVESHLSEVSRLIATDSAAGKLLPNFRLLLRKTIREVSRKPISLELSNPQVPTEHVKVQLSAIDIQLIAGSLLGRRPTIELIPRVFGPARHGDYSAIASYVPEVRATEISAMGAVMDCASSVSNHRWRIIKRQASKTVLGTLLDFPLPEWCRAWGVPRLPKSFRAPVRSNMPVLFVEGTLDGQTPLSNAIEVRRGFSKGALFTISNAGHDGSMFQSSPELIEAINRFIAGAPTSDQRFKAPPLHFSLPGGTTR